MVEIGERGGGAGGEYRGELQNQNQNRTRTTY